MKRKLLKQISNEWRSNLWLAVELLIISSVLWYIMDYVGVFSSLSSESMGVDTDHVYQLTIKSKPEDSPTFEPYTEEEGSWSQFERVMNRLREHPDIEYVASGSNAVYNYNFSGIWANPVDALPDSAVLITDRNNRFWVTSDYPKVFNMHGINGETPEQLASVLEEGKLIITSNAAGGSMTPRDLLNLRVTLGNDSSIVYTIGAVVEPIRRAEFEPAWHTTTLIPSNNINEVYFRVKPEADRDFARRLLEESGKSLNYGNMYVADVYSFDTIRENLHHDDYAQQRNMYVCMGFLLLTVFLGILGTFWFRTQQRAKELAIRITAGATRLQLFARLIGEGLLLLVIVTPLALGLDWLITYYNFNASTLYWGQDAWPLQLKAAAIVFGCMAVMIIGGILFPALRAMKIEPAVILGGE